MDFDQKQILEILLKVKNTPSESLESEIIEFKNYSNENALHNSKDIAEEISALANVKGGIIIIGVKDNKDVSFGKWEEQLNGFDRVDLDTVKERITGKLKPQIKLIFTHVEFEQKNYLCINIPKRIDSIISTSSGKTCIRDGKSSRPASPDEIRDLVKSLQFYDWSTEDLLNMNIDEALNLDAILESKKDHCYKRKINIENVSNNSYLESIGVTKNGILNKGGLLFLGKSEYIQKYLGNYEYRFSWKTNGGDLKINEVWSDCLWNTINKAKKHFNQCNGKINFEWKNKSYELYQLDEIAFHEAFLNALVHRDYSHNGMVTVNFVGSQLKMTSPGSFYGGINSDNIVYHEPRHRNKSLAKTLMLFQLVDRAGIGITRMGIRSLTHGRSFPMFIEKHDHIEVVMEVEYFRAGIFVITSKGDFSISELFILNSVYEIGYILISDLEKKMKKLAEDPWGAITKAMKNEKLKSYIEYKGNNKGVYICVKSDSKTLFDVKNSLRTNTTSGKHVDLFHFIKQYGSGSNEEITNLLNHKYPSQTSVFLRKTEFVKKGKTKASKWTLK